MHEIWGVVLDLLGMSGIQGLIFGSSAFGLLWLLKLKGIVPADGEDAKKRLALVLATTGAGVIAALEQHFHAGTVVEWEKLVRGLVTGIIGFAVATVWHVLTKPKK